MLLEQVISEVVTPLTVSANEITDIVRAACASLGTSSSGQMCDAFSVPTKVTNLCTNGGFETNTTGWNNFGGGVISRITTQSKYGSACLQITATVDVDGGYCDFSGLAPGWTYTVSAWVLASVGETVQLSVESNIGAFVAAVQWVGNAAFTQKSVSFTAGSAGTARLAFVSVSAAQVFLLDGVQLEIGSVAHTYVETNGAIATSVTAAVADSSFGIRRAATNLFRRGQCDTTGDTGTAHFTVSVDATMPFPFSTQSLKCVGDGTQAEINFQTATGQGASAGTLCPGSLYVMAPAGATYNASIRIVNTDASQTNATNTSVVGTGAPQLVRLPALAVAAGKTGDRIDIRLIQTSGRVETIWVGHAMIEKGQAVVAPYVATSGGSTATHNAGRIQVAVSSGDETRMWAAFYARYGFASTVSRSVSAYLLDFRDDANNLLGLWLDTANKWNAGRLSAGAGSPAQSAAQTFAVADKVLVVFACAASAIKVSVGGGAFTSVANSSIPVLAATLFDIGSQGGTSQLDGDVLWAAWGLGTTPVDADVAALNSNLVAGIYPVDLTDLPVGFWA